MKRIFFIQFFCGLLFVILAAVAAGSAKPVAEQSTLHPGTNPVRAWAAGGAAFALLVELPVVCLCQRRGGSRVIGMVVLWWALGAVTPIVLLIGVQLVHKVWSWLSLPK